MTAPIHQNPNAVIELSIALEESKERERVANAEIKRLWEGVSSEVVDDEPRRIYTPAEIHAVKTSLWQAWWNCCSEEANEPEENFCTELNDGWDVWEAVLVIEQLQAQIASLSALPATPDQTNEQ